MLPTAAPILQAVSDVTGYPVAAMKATGRSGPEAVKVMVRDGAMSADLGLSVVKEAEGNAEKAIEVATVKAAGKTKATAKHLSGGEVRETLKSVVKDILRESEIKEPALPEGDDMVSVRIP